jgi:hypothetical protein
MAQLVMGMPTSYSPPDQWDQWEKLPRDPVAMQAFNVAIPVLAVIAVAMYLIVTYAYERYGKSDDFEGLVSPLQLPDFNAEDLFISGTAWDEAAAWIALFDTLSAIPRILNSRIVLAVLYAMVAWTFRATIVSWCSSFELGHISTWFRPLEALTVFLTAPALVLYLVPAAFAVVARSFAYGFEGPLHAALFDVWAARTPPGIARWRGYVSQGRGLTHSRLYDDPNVHRDVAQWISAKLDAGQD